MLAAAPPAAQAAGFAAPQERHAAVSVSTYTDLLRAISRGALRTATLDDRAHVAAVVFRDGRRADVRYPAADAALPVRMANAGVEVRIAQSSAGLLSYLTPLLLLSILVMAAVSMVHRRRRQQTGAPASIGEGAIAERRIEMTPVAPNTRFADVAGCDEAVEELAEIVEFLRTPERFALVDARMPAGLLLSGPPGTGKTMLARALAGEAGVHFYAASASEFVEKFVGVGASRVRDLFRRALANAPAVIFIDELDAIGRSRNSHDGNGEREQTLNELLVQMDGFAVSDHIVVVGATNRPDVLDDALLRPGRFSRQISVGLPSVEGRQAILAVHGAPKPFAPDVDLTAIAAMTGGFSGAQLAELLNEAAIMAARENRLTIEAADVREGLRRVIAGPRRRSAPIAAGELEKIAYHEAGHVVCAELCERHENAQHVTIDPRGQAMGFALFGHEDRALYDEEHLHDAMVAALGGRAAEQLVFGRASSGAKNDLEKASAIARAAVTEYGMTSRIGQFAGDERLLSNQSRALIDREVERLIAAAYGDALALLDANRPALDTLAARLLDARELERIDIVTALSPLGPERVAG
jgi:cell division protease FtsH